MYWMPSSRVGKTSFWVAVVAFAFIYCQYWLAMILQVSIPAPLGILPVICLIAAGIASVVAWAKFKDRAILLMLSALFGLFGLILILGELILPH
jgi:hypothetical protein